MKIEIDQIWRVADRQRLYLARVTGFQGDRIEIQEISSAPVVRTTPTLAHRSMFGTGAPRNRGFQLVWSAA